MKLSKSELERIKSSHKAKTTKEIIAEEKKDQSDDDDNPNFISSITNNHNVKAAQEKRENLYQSLKDELGNITKKLRKAIRPFEVEVRSLDNEVGGLEVDYKKIKKEIDEDVDVWDSRATDIVKEAAEIQEQDQEENESFIHMVKTGMLGGSRKRRKRRRSMGQVDLGAANEDVNHKKSKEEERDEFGNIKESYTEKIQRLRSDNHDHEGGGGLGF